MKYPLAEKFFAPQGEGLYTGTPMAFLRFVGCSVGKKICNACDTNFEQMDKTKGGGLFDIDQIVSWAKGFEHVCLTGGEPLDRNLEPLIDALNYPGSGVLCHIETSGTKKPEWLDRVRQSIWLCVSPKPGYLIEMVREADEIKIILQGLGQGSGWPSLGDAVQWAEAQLVYIQPRNSKEHIDSENLERAIQTVLQHPSLRLSVQLHKFINTR